MNERVVGTVISVTTCELLGKLLNLYVIPHL